MMLKAKIHDMKRNGANAVKVKSIAERRLERKLKAESLTEADKI